MKRTIIEKLKRGENKKLFSNFISLSFLHAANLILPLLTFPYLVRTLGIEIYGLTIFAQAFISYFSLVAEYGFVFSGTREISLNKTNKKHLTRTYNSIMTARFVLVILCLIVMSAIVFCFNKFSIHWELYFLTYGIVIGTALFPTWFFQGMEKMKYITILSVISKVIFTISIFVFVKSPSDYLWVPILNSGGYIFVGIISMIIINKHFKIPFQIQKNKYIWEQLQQGWYIFISTISTNLYTTTTTVVLGLVTNTTMVGYYAIAEKVLRIIVATFTPFTQTIFPHVVQLAKKSSQETVVFLRRILQYTLSISICMWLIGVVFAEPIFKLLFNINVAHSIIIFRILSPLILILPIASILFNIILLPFKMDKYFSKIYITGAILNLILLGVLLFGFKLSTIGAAVSLIICELVITIYAAIVLQRNNIKVFSLYK
jgi:PST family polysaccharide transporter